MRLRPTIDNVLKRFEHIHALLVATSSANVRFNPRLGLELELASHRESKPNLDNFVLDHLRRAPIHSVRHTQISFR